MLSIDTCLQRNTDILASHLDNEIVMLDEKVGLYFGLNPVASQIWTLLETPTCIAQLITALTQHFEVSDKQCEQDMLPFLETMLQHQLIRIVSV